MSAKILTCLVAAASCFLSCARDLPAPVAAKNERSVRAFIEAVDPHKGTARLRSERGGTITLRTRAQPPGFAHLAPGTPVNVKLLQAVAIELGPKVGNHDDSRTISARAARTRLGALPEGASVSTFRVEAIVVGIDRNARLVVLQKPDGELAVISAGDKAKDLDKVQPGDVLSVEYSEAVVVELPAR